MEHNRNSKEQRPKKKIGETFYKNGVKVIVGQKPNYPKEKAESLNKMIDVQKREVQCEKCGQYWHNADSCKNLGQITLVTLERIVRLHIFAIEKTSDSLTKTCSSFPLPQLLTKLYF